MECAIVGAGAVAREYVADIETTPLTVTAVVDTDATAADTLAAQVGATGYTDLDRCLTAEGAPLVINLTPHRVHAGVTAAAIDAGRHVFSEKPLALDPAVATDLVDRAAAAGVGLAAAPIAPTAPAQRTLATLIGAGQLGPVRLVRAHANVGRVDHWHPAPDAYLQVSPVFDAAVYPLALLQRLFGPVTAVQTAHSSRPWPPDAPTPSVDTHVTATCTLAAGVTLELSSSYYVPHTGREFFGMELVGDTGTAYLPDAGGLRAQRLRVAGPTGDATPVGATHPYPPRRYIDGPAALAAAVRAGRRPDGRAAAAVVRACAAILATAAGAPIPLGDADRPRRGPAAPTYGGTRTGLRLPRVGLGCSRYRDGRYVERGPSFAAALAMGYRLFDSAELYGTETQLGRALAGPLAPDREAVVLIGKAWNTNHRHLREACAGSLGELGIDAFDLYMLHWPDAWAYRGPLRRLRRVPPALEAALTFPTDADGERARDPRPLAETWADLEQLCRDGYTDAIGICNVSVSTLRSLCAEAAIAPAAVQVASTPFAPRADLVAFCRDRGIRVIAHSPLADARIFTDPTIAAVADAHDVGPASVALAYQVDRGVVPIPSSVDADHLAANLAAGAITLTDAERAQLAGLAA